MSDTEIMLIACSASAFGCVIGFAFGWMAARDGRTE